MEYYFSFSLKRHICEMRKVEILFLLNIKSIYRTCIKLFMFGNFQFMLIHDRYTGDPKKMFKAQKSRKNLRTAQTKGKFLILFQESSKSKSECRS